LNISPPVLKSNSKEESKIKENINTNSLLRFTNNSPIITQLSTNKKKTDKNCVPLKKKLNLPKSSSTPKFCNQSIKKEFEILSLLNESGAFASQIDNNNKSLSNDVNINLNFDDGNYFNSIIKLFQFHFNFNQKINKSTHRTRTKMKKMLYF
jgi:hypothetical protein